MFKPKRKLKRFILTTSLASLLTFSSSPPLFDTYLNKVRGEEKSKIRVMLLESPLNKLTPESLKLLQKRVRGNSSIEDLIPILAAIASIANSTREVLNDSSLASLLSNYNLRITILDPRIEALVRGKRDYSYGGVVDYTGNEIYVVLYLPSSLMSIPSISTAITQHEFIHVYFKKKFKDIGYEAEIPALAFQMLFSPLRHRIPSPYESYYISFFSYALALNFYEENKELYEISPREFLRKFLIFMELFLEDSNSREVGKLEKLLFSLENELFKSHERNSINREGSYLFYNRSLILGEEAKLLIVEFSAKYSKAETIEEKMRIMKEFLKGINGKKVYEVLEKIMSIRESFPYKNEKIEYLFSLIVDYTFFYYLTPSSLKTYLSTHFLNKYPPVFLDDSLDRPDSFLFNNSSYKE